MRSKRKELGQFFTHPKIAEFMAGLVIDDKTTSVLDPSVGEGIFLEKCFKINNNLQFKAYDIDFKMIEYVSEFPFHVSLINGDYLVNFESEKYDAIICNPPYNKFQQIKNRADYIKLFKEKYGVRISGYSNLCVYFLIKSLNELSENGKCAFIIPYEFLNTGYGIAIKNYIIKKKSLKRVYKFNSNLNLFDEGLTTSCILYFENSINDSVEFIEINELAELERQEFSSKIVLPLTDIDPKEKWIKYFDKNGLENNPNLQNFFEIARVKRGIATGSNAFFALSKTDIEKHNLSQSVCVKCVAKSPDIKKLIFTQKYFDELYENGKKVYLFDGTKATCESDFEYITYGEESGVNKTYLNSHRIPWYLLENKKPAPIWISVFSRNRLKVIRNETNARTLTTFHNVYVHSNDEDFINILFCYLLTPIGQDILYKNKREYGGGLDKFEPNDLNYAKVLNLTALTDDDKKEILEIYQSLRNTENEDYYINKLNNVFLKYI